MANDTISSAGISRRNFIRLATSSLITLPTIGGVGVFSQERVALAQEADGRTPGSVISDEELAKITVVTATECAVVVIDTAKGEYGFLPGAHVTLISRYNKKKVEGDTDQEGKVIFDIRNLAENLKDEKVDELEEYEFNATIQVSCKGYRGFEMPLTRVRGTDVMVACTRDLSADANPAYPYSVSLDEWDILYTSNRFILAEGNKDDHELRVEGHSFGSEKATVSVRMREGSAPFTCDPQTVTPSGGVIKATFKQPFLKKGDAKALSLDCKYEIQVVQGDYTYTWPIHIELEEGVIEEPVEDKIQLKPLSTGISSTPNSQLDFKWPDSIPLVGGTRSQFVSAYQLPVSIYMNPFGFVQVTASLPLYGYKRDNGGSNKQGWGRYPYASQAAQREKVYNSINDLTDKASDSFFADGFINQIDFMWSFKMMAVAQLIAALQYDIKKGYLQGMGGGQINITADLTITEQFWFGPFPVLISFGISVNTIVGLTFGIWCKSEDSGDMPASKLIPYYLLNVASWHLDYSNTGVNVGITVCPSLTVGVGLKGLASACLKGRFLLSMTFSLLTVDNFVDNRPWPHAVGGWQADLMVVLQFLFFSQTFYLAKKKYTEIFNNWKGGDLSSQSDLDLAAQAEEAMRGMFLRSSAIITDEMMSELSEADGELALVEQANEGVGLFSWDEVRVDDVVGELDEGGTLTYQVYHFPSRAEALGELEATAAQDTQESAPTADAAAETQAAEPTGDVAADKQVAEPTGDVAAEAQAAESTADVAVLAAEVTDPAAQVAMPQADAGASALEAQVSDTTATDAATADEAATLEAQETTSATDDATVTAAAAQTPTEDTTVTAAAETPEQAAPQRVPGAAVWHRGSSVRYAQAAPIVDGVLAQAEGAPGDFLPKPDVERLGAAGGVVPTVDYIISTTDDDEPRLVYGDPHIQVIDIQTGVTLVDGEQVGIRATCAFRIGTVNIAGVGTRSRLVMTILDASDALSYFVGTQRIIEFDLPDGKDGMTHSQLYDYDYSLAFTSYSVETSLASATQDQVQICIVSGLRPQGDETTVVNAASNLYFTYLCMDATDLFSDEPIYLSVTWQASGGVTSFDSRYHAVTNVRCVAESADGIGANLLVAYLDRSSDTPDGIISDDPSLVTVRPGFLFFQTDPQGHTDMAVIDSSSLDTLVGGFNDATVFDMSLSPEIGGHYTLSLRGSAMTYFYVLDYDVSSFSSDSSKNGFTSAVWCPVLDDRITLIPWPEQDCFLTTYASEEYRESDEFAIGGPDDWDRSQWSLHTASWEDNGSGGYRLAFRRIGPDNFNLTSFALNSGGSFIFWPEGRTSSDEILYDMDGNLLHEDDGPLYQIKACRVRTAADGQLHFSDPFVAAEVAHDIDSLAAVATHDRYAPFEVLSTELVDVGRTVKDNYGDDAPLYYASHLWYTSVPNVHCATVVASNCTLPAVSAGGVAKFDVTVRNDGNSFLASVHLQMFLHDIEVDDDGNAIEDAEGHYIDHGVSPVPGAELDLVFGEDTLRPSLYDEYVDGAFVAQEPDFALPPGKRSIYRVTMPIPADWAGPKWVSFWATKPRMAVGGGLAALADDVEPEFVEFSIEPGSYQVIEQRSNPTQDKNRHYMDMLSVTQAAATGTAINDTPVRVEKTGSSVNDGGRSGGQATGSGSALPRTGDPSSMAVPAGLALAGAALAAYGKRRAENERRERESED